MKVERLLFVDPRQDWLDFVKSALSCLYEVHTAQDFCVLSDSLKQEQVFDLIFIGLNSAQDNIEMLSDLAQKSRWRFIVLFPGFPDRNTFRIFFKAGVWDLLSKPYDIETLREVVKEQIKHMKKHVAAAIDSKGKGDYTTQVSQLLKCVESEKTGDFKEVFL